MFVVVILAYIRASVGVASLFYASCESLVSTAEVCELLMLAVGLTNSELPDHLVYGDSLAWWELVEHKKTFWGEKCSLITCMCSVLGPRVTWLFSE